MGAGGAGGGLSVDVSGVKGVGVVEAGTGVGRWGAVKGVGFAIKGSSGGFCVCECICASWFLCAALAT
jgi:hypothetical protein